MKIIMQSLVMVFICCAAASCISEAAAAKPRPAASSSNSSSSGAVGPTLSFGSPQSVAVGQEPRSLAVNDSGGILQLVVANAGGRTLSTFTPSSSGPLAASIYPVGYAVSVVANYSMVTANFLEGTVSIVKPDHTSNTIAVRGGPTRVILNNADAFVGHQGGALIKITDVQGPNPTTSEVANSYSRVGDIAIADIDGDMLPDTVLTIPEFAQIDLLRHDSTTRVWNVLDGPERVAVRNTNSDSFPDLIVSHPQQDGTYLYIQNSDGSLALPVKLSVGGAAFVIADVDGDGLRDLVTADTLGVIRVNSPMISPVRSWIMPCNGSVSDLAVMDVNLDGKPDVVAAMPAANQILWFANASTH